MVAGVRSLESGGREGRCAVHLEEVARRRKVRAG